MEGVCKKYLEWKDKIEKRIVIASQLFCKKSLKLESKIKTGRYGEAACVHLEGFAALLL